MRMPKVTILRMMIAVAAAALLAVGLRAASAVPTEVSSDGGGTCVVWSDGTVEDTWGRLPTKFHEYPLAIVVEWSDGSYRIHPRLP